MIRGASDLRNAVDSHLFLRRAGPNTVLVQHDKSRHAPPVDSFQFEICDDLDGLVTHIRYTGQMGDGGVKSARARELILQMLKEEGTCRRKDMLTALRAEGVSARTIDSTVSELIAHGIVCKAGHGSFRLAHWT